MPLAAWLDVGYAILIDGADSTWRELLEELFSAEDDAAVEDAFGALVEEGEYRRNQRDEVERKHRAATGGPVRVRRMSERVVQEAFDDVASWGDTDYERIEPAAPAGAKVRRAAAE